MKARGLRLGLLLVAALAVLWAVPFAWMLVASVRPGFSPDIASLAPPPPYVTENYVDAWQSGDFPLWYLNTAIVCLGILLINA